MRVSKLDINSIISSDKIELLNTDQITLNELCRMIDGMSRSQVIRNLSKMVRAGLAPQGLLRFAMIQHYYDRYTAVFVVGDSVVQMAPAKARITASEEKLREVGYNLDADEPTGEQIWREQARVFERTFAKTSKQRLATLKNPNGTGAFIMAHFTDVHLDDNGCALSLLEEDINASHRIGAITMHGGDALNAWPHGGKLAKKNADQHCTLSDSLKLLEHYINILQPKLWVDGNHEEMLPVLDELIIRALPRSVARDYWTIRFNVETPGGRTVKGAMSHKFSKGNSYFHALQGQIREAMEGEAVDVRFDGHMHRAGVMQHYLPERDQTTLMIASSGYKLYDKFAARISQGGKHARIAGRAHWIVSDPQLEFGPNCTAFICPDQAEAYAEGLQNLRAA